MTTFADAYKNREAELGGTMSQKQWMCLNCGYVYRQETGDPEGGVPPGTPWEKVPDTWKCPDCAATKADFDMVEI